MSCYKLIYPLMFCVRCVNNEMFIYISSDCFCKLLDFNSFVSERNIVKNYLIKSSKLKPVNV